MALPINFTIHMVQFTIDLRD